MSIETINIGVIGAGGSHAMRSHEEYLAQLPHNHLAVLSDISEHSAQAAAGRFAPDAHTTTYWEELVGDSSVDAVLVMTPDKWHTMQMAAAIANNKHVLVEKPLADSWEDFEIVKASLAVAHDKGLVVSSCHPRRFSRPYVETKRLLDDDALLAETFGLHKDHHFGAVSSFNLNLNYPRPSKTGLHTSFASDHMPHEIDTASHFFGFAGISRAVSRRNNELDFAIEAERDDGIKLQFTGNRLQDQPGYREDWHVTFEDGTVFSVESHEGAIQLQTAGQTINRQPRDAHGQPLFKVQYDEHFTALNRHFVESIANPGKEIPYLTRQELLMNTVVGLALQEVDKPVSIDTDGTVTKL
jgi:predicted dehydrogenase